LVASTSTSVAPLSSVYRKWKEWLLAWKKRCSAETAGLFAPEKNTVWRPVVEVGRTYTLREKPEPALNKEKKSKGRGR
jgi:hypothetical protein